MKRLMLLLVVGGSLLASSIFAIIQTTHSGNPSCTAADYNMSGGYCLSGTLVTDITDTDFWEVTDTEPKAQANLGPGYIHIETTAGGGGGGGEKGVKVTSVGVGPVTADTCVDFQHEVLTDLGGVFFMAMFDDDLNAFDDSHLKLFYGLFAAPCGGDVWCVSDDAGVSNPTSSGVTAAGVQNLTLCGNGTAYINNGQTTISHHTGFSGSGNLTFYWQTGGGSSGNEDINISKIFTWEKTSGAPQQSEADVCAPTSPLSGDYTFDCSENCVISSQLDAGGNDIYTTGSGQLTVTSTISNFNRIVVNQGTCDLVCEDGNCFT